MSRLGRGGLIALFVALSVLIHHGSTQSMLSSPHEVERSMTAQKIDHAAHHSGAGGCSSSGLQMCMAASTDTVTVALPVQPLVDWLLLPRTLRSGEPSGRTVARGPPDLSVLSVLRQ